jgi:hypothetical protein
MREHLFQQFDVDGKTSGYRYLWEKHPEIAPEDVTKIWSQIAENGSGSDASGAVFPGSGGGI